MSRQSEVNRSCTSLVTMAIILLCTFNYSNVKPILRLGRVEPATPHWFNVPHTVQCAPFNLVQLAPTQLRKIILFQIISFHSYTHNIYIRASHEHLLTWGRQVGHSQQHSSVSRRRCMMASKFTLNLKIIKNAKTRIHVFHSAHNDVNMTEHRYRITWWDKSP